jgi:uncharacterized protein (DUF2384 family)
MRDNEQWVRERVADVFGGDAAKMERWMVTRNPLLGDVSPREMLRLHRGDRLARFISSVMAETASLPEARPGHPRHQ